jgi:hypothetical protein
MSRRAGNWQASEGSFRRQHPSCSIPKGTSCYKKGLGPGRPLRSRWRSLEFFGGCHLAEVLGACGMWWGGGVVFSHTIPTKEKNMGHLNTVHPGWAGSSGSHLAERAGSSQRGRPWVLDVPKGTGTTGTTQKHSRKGVNYHILQWFPTRVGFTIHNPTLFWGGCRR